MQKQISSIDLNNVLKTNSKACIIDVRTPLEFQSTHVENSRNIPLPDILAKSSGLDRDAEIYLMCRSGKRASMAASQLESFGINSTVVSGGILAWQAAGLPVATGRRCMPIESQAQVIVGSVLALSSFLAFRGSLGFLGLTALCGAGLVYAGLTGDCIMAKALMKAPWNNKDEKVSQSSPKGGSCCS